MENVEKAFDLFRQGFNCSQAVFTAFAPSLGMETEAALKVAAGFGGGMGLMGETCGAVTGAFMALGLKFGHVSPQDKAGKGKLYGLVREFAKRFAARNGPPLCRNLLGLDMSTPEGLKLAAERNVHVAVCPKFVRDAAEILDEMLKQAGG